MMLKCDVEFAVFTCTIDKATVVINKGMNFFDMYHGYTMAFFEVLWRTI